MNAANYNWTEPINRASDKPGEIHLAKIGDVGAGYYSASRLVELLACPPMPIRPPIGVQQVLELLGHMHKIYDTRGHAV